MPREPKQRQPTARRNPNGEGSIYQRSSDGRWVGQAYVLTTDGTRKRKFVYGATWEEAHAKLVELKSRSQRGIPVPDRAWKLADYLPYWLAAYVSDLKPTTARVRKRGTAAPDPGPRPQAPRRLAGPARQGVHGRVPQQVPLLH